MVFSTALPWWMLGPPFVAGGRGRPPLGRQSLLIGIRIMAGLPHRRNNLYRSVRQRAVSGLIGQWNSRLSAVGTLADRLLGGVGHHTVLTCSETTTILIRDQAVTASRRMQNMMR